MLLAIDPGYRNIGYCVGDLNTKSVVVSGTIVTTGSNFPGQLQQIYNKIQSLINTYNITTLVYEKPVYKVGHETGNKVQQGIAILLLLTAINNISVVVTYKPSEIKQKVTGNGKADKNSVKLGVLKYFPNISFDADHESDSIAMFISYLKDVGIVG